MSETGSCELPNPALPLWDSPKVSQGEFHIWKVTVSRYPLVNVPKASLRITTSRLVDIYRWPEKFGHVPSGKRTKKLLKIAISSELSHEKHGDFPVRYVNVYQAG